MSYSISNNYLEIIAGTLNTISPVYMEASNNVEKDTDTGLKYLKNFITSIENIATKDSVKDERISKTKGNIKSFDGYKNIETVMNFLTKNLGSIQGVEDCKTVLTALEKLQPLYSDGYDKNMRLVILEYENALYLLVTSLSALMSTNMEVVANGTEIRIQRKFSSTHGVIEKTMRDLAKQLKDPKHKSYLEDILKAVDNKEVAIREHTSFLENTILDSIEIVISAIKNSWNVGKKTWGLLKDFKRSMFGIIPLIRSIIYLRYKKKADTILSLDQQAAFIELNIEMLKNNKTIDEKKKAIIIKKQKAYVDQYKKKAEKLRAELMEMEKEAAQDIEKENPQMKSIEEDLVLESAIFFESEYEEKRLPKHIVTKMEKIKKSLSGKNDTKSGINKDEIKTRTKKLIEKFRDDHQKDFIDLIPSKVFNDDPIEKRTASKVGGIPYLPKGMELPKMKSPKYDKTHMMFLAQLNFDELPKLKGFPSTGILQFYVDMINEDYKLIYHDKIVDKTEYQDIDKNETTLGDKFVNKHQSYKGVSYLSGSIKKDCMNLTDNSFWEEIDKYIDAEFSGEHENVHDESFYMVFDLANQILKGESSKYFKIGGYPNFNGEDFREPKEREYELLLQLELPVLKWENGNGIVFFINKKSLDSKDFSTGKNIIYSYN